MKFNLKLPEALNFTPFAAPRTNRKYPNTPYRFKGFRPIKSGQNSARKVIEPMGLVQSGPQWLPIVKSTKIEYNKDDKIDIKCEPWFHPRDVRHANRNLLIEGLEESKTELKKETDIKLIRKSLRKCHALLIKTQQALTAIRIKPQPARTVMKPPAPKRMKLSVPPVPTTRVPKVTKKMLSAFKPGKKEAIFPTFTPPASPFYPFPIKPSKETKDIFPHLDYPSPTGPMYSKIDLDNDFINDLPPLDLDIDFIPSKPEPMEHPSIGYYFK